MKLALGAAQFGQPYGTFNLGDTLDEASIGDFLNAAKALGTELIDTAQAYGQSEEMLGRLGAAKEFKIVTKIAPLGRAVGRAEIKSLVWRSLSALETESVYGLLLHEEQDLIGPNADLVWEELESIRSSGRAIKIGVSVYSASILRTVCRRYLPDLVQLPYSIIDRRFGESGAIDELHSKGIEIHARSLFLQGFALAREEDLPVHLTRHAGELRQFRAACWDSGVSQLEACLAFVKCDPRISRAVVGAQTIAQWSETVAAWSKSSQLSDFDYGGSQVEELVDPSRWKRPR